MEMSRRKGRLRVLVLVLLASILCGGLAACRQKAPLTQAEQDAGFRIYCINNTETKVVSEAFLLEEGEPEAQIEELIAGLMKEPQDFTCKKALPDSVTLRSWSLDGGQLTLDFEANYSNLVGISEILRRTAIVKTLCQVEEVKYVDFTVGGQPLMDSNAQPIGMMTSSDFIDNTGGETNYTQTVTITLYYTGENGKTLKQSRHMVEFDGTISLEALVIQQVVAGPLPEEEGLYPTLSPNTQLIKVSKKDGICYVDFNSVFLDKLPEVSDEVAIYSVVNSLAEISGVSKVQFTINGETQRMYREAIPFDGLFERNLDLVETVN